MAKLMPIICSQCGAEVNLDADREFGFCSYCGTKFLVQNEIRKIQISGSVSIDNSAKFKNLLSLADQSYVAGNYQEAYACYSRALELDQSFYAPFLMRALCVGWLSSVGNIRSAEMLTGMNKAISVAKPDERLKIQSQIKQFVSKFRISRENEYSSAAECAGFANSILEIARLFRQLSGYCDMSNKWDASTFKNSTVDVQKNIKRGLRYVAGVKIENGKPETIYELYRIPMEIRSAVQAVVDYFDQCIQSIEAEQKREMQEKEQKRKQALRIKLEPKMKQLTDKIEALTNEIDQIQIPGFVKFCLRGCAWYTMIVLAVLAIVLFAVTPVLAIIPGAAIVACFVLNCIGRSKQNALLGQLPEQLAAKRKELEQLESLIR